MKKGFTLIELLVVVLIIGILAAIAVPQYQKSVDRSRFSQLLLAAKAIANADETFYIANGRYAKDFTELDINFPQATYNNNKDIANFDWGWCTLSLNYPRCGLNNLNVVYYIHLPETQEWTTFQCSAETESERAMDLCRMAVPEHKATPTPAGNTCIYPCTLFYPL